MAVIRKHRSLPRAVNVNDLLTLAKRRLPKAVFDYMDGGAEDEVTLRQNCEAFKQVTFRPKQVRQRASCCSPRRERGRRIFAEQGCEEGFDYFAEITKFTVALPFAAIA